MINAIVQNKQGETAVIDLTVHYHEIYKELQSLGYYSSPERLLLRDEEDEEYSVKLYSDSDIGNSMILLLNERDSLYDAYLLDLAVTNAREEIKTDLEQNLMHGQYTTFSEVLDDINQMKIEAAETRLTFFCPLEATIYDDEGYYSRRHSCDRVCSGGLGLRSLGTRSGKKQYGNGVCQYRERKLSVN